MKLTTSNSFAAAIFTPEQIFLDRHKINENNSSDSYVNL